MTLRKSILLFIGLGMIAALVACSSSSTKTPPAITIAATSGGGQSAVVGAPFTNTLVATVMSGTTPASGVTVTFTAPGTGASGTFATPTPGVTDTETTNSSGVATSQIFTANTTAGAYSVTASTSGAATPASYSLTNTAGAPAAIAATGGTPQSAAVGATYGSLVAQVTDGDSNGVAGVTVTFTANTGGTGASGTFTSTTSNTETATTDANGNATVTDLVANSTTGAFTVTADFTGDTGTAASFALTNTVAVAPPLAAGNYVYYLTGEDSNEAGSGIYFVTGVFTVSASGAVTGGEQTFSDFNLYEQDNIVGATSSVSTGNNGNLLITIDTGDTNIGVAGVETFDASMVTASNGLLTEYDGSASGSGTLDLQTSTAAPSGGYAFFAGGWDANGNTIVTGGVVNVDSSGGISGAGSVFDQNDGGALSPDQLFAASTVVGPDALGQVVFTLNPQTPSSTVLEFEMVGYVVDANHIRWVENWNVDGLSATTGGVALGQNGKNGTYSSSNLSGSNGVFGTVGADGNGPLQVAGLLTFNSDGTLGGNVSSNDLVSQSPQGGGTLVAGGTWTIDASGTGNDGGTGRVTISNVTDDATFGPYNFQLYLAKDGGTVISMDGTDAVAGLGYAQQSSSFSAASFSGNYSLNIDQQDTFTDGFEFDGIGTVTADGTSAFTGFVDLNADLTPTSGTVGGVTGTFTSSTNGVFPGTISGISSSGAPSDLFTFYLIGATSGASVGAIGIENDTDQLTLGTFELQ